MSHFSLSVRSFTVPELPDQPTDVSPSVFRSPLLPSIIAATTPLSFTVSLSSPRETDPLYPATHLQLAYNYKGTGEIFVPSFITAKDLIKSSTDEEPNLYTIQVPPNDIPRAKVSSGGTSTAEVTVYAWRGEKLLGQWDVGRIERLGIVGLKPHRLATEITE